MGIAISDTLTTTPVFSSETKELHHLHMELQLLKDQVQDVARVCNAVARGDLSQKIAVPVQGIVMVQLKDVINTMVDKLGQFAKEVTHVSQEVGTEGSVLSQISSLSLFYFFLLGGDVRGRKSGQVGWSGTCTRP